MESSTETPHEVLLINGLAKVTNDPFVQGADPGGVIMGGSHKDRWNRKARIGEVSVKFGAGNPSHLDVGNQAGSFNETSLSMERALRDEYLSGVHEKPHEPFV